MKFVLCVFLLSIVCALGQDSNLPDDPMDERRGPNEQCLRCICHARSGCYFLRNCANYSISRDYWIRAGRPTVLDDDPNDDSSYSSCMKDDGCVMRSIRGYLNSVPNRDCNCNGKVDCKDYAAIHLKQGECRQDFDPNQLRRLDSCLEDRKVPHTKGWSMGCPLPPAQ